MVEVLGCCPLSIPLQDITLTYASTGAAGDGSLTLHYTPASGFTPASWETDCLDAGTYSVIPAADPTHNYFKFQLSCSIEGETSIHFDLYINGTPCSGPPQALGGPITYTFSTTPFHLHADVTSAYPPLYYGGFTSLDYDSPANVTAACKYIFTISGNGLAVSGATVSAWTSAAKTTLLGTATTDSGGNCLIVSPEKTTNGHYEVTGSRFISASGNGLVASGTNPNSIGLSPSTGYQFDSGTCGWPISETLHAVHPVFGALTYTYSAGHWIATAVYSYPGNIVGGGSCSAATVTVTCDMDEGYGYSESWLYDGSDCPTDAGGNTAAASWTFGGVDCYVPSVTAFMANFSLTPTAGPQQNLYGATSLALTITE